MHVFEGSTVSPMTPTIHHKGISKFCVNELGAPSYGLCLAVKKKLALYTWTISKSFGFVKVRRAHCSACTYSMQCVVVNLDCVHCPTGACGS